MLMVNGVVDVQAFSSGSSDKENNGNTRDIFSWLETDMKMGKVMARVVIAEWDSG